MALAAALFALRGGQLATRQAVGEPAERVARVASIHHASPGAVPPASRAGEGPLSAGELSLIATVCPTGYDALPVEWVSAPRLAARPTEGPAADWLVSPDDWYVPEDRPPASPLGGPVAAPAEEGPTEPDPAPATPLFAPPAPAAPVEAPRFDPAEPAARGPAPAPRAIPGFLPPGPLDQPRPESAAPPSFPPSAPEAVAPPAGRPVFSPPEAPPNLPSPHGGDRAQAAAEARAAAGGKSADESHRELFARNCYPSARECAECHRRTYEEWSVSSHAYAFVSPMFHKFEQTITELSNGTVGHFCYRCHAPVATAMNVSRAAPIGRLAEVEREGVTCIACHRVNERNGKSNGERRIVPGDIHQPVYGGVGGDGVARAVADPDRYKVKVSRDQKGPGQPIHREGRFFDQLGMSEACASCHQVAVHPGIKLEVVWEQYRASPACKKGVSCQDCHMGRVPGVPSGYHYGPIAEVNGKTVNDCRKQSNHTFFGPGYSIAHPGVFPQHKDSSRWTIDEWLQFDWRAGWGTDEFEERVEWLAERGAEPRFPPAWAEVDDRFDAREIIEDNQKKLERKRRYRELVMENGSHVDGPFFRCEPAVGRPLKFEYVVTNTNEGHNLPTASLGAQPQLWANVALIGPDGRRLWETGYTDSKGDLCDIHSEDVRHGRAPYDTQLFNLQTMFLITGATGTDREFFLPVNLSVDPLAQLRPGALPISVLNHPPLIRMESRSIAPLGKKRVKYRVPAELMTRPGSYRLSFRMRSRVEPPYFMRFCGATEEMQRGMIDGTLDIHPMSVEFEVK